MGHFNFNGHEFCKTGKVFKVKKLISTFGLFFTYIQQFGRQYRQKSALRLYDMNYIP